MAENQIKIKLVLDTSDSGKIKAELDKTLDVQKDINAYTQKQTELTRQVAARYNEVYEKINQIAGKAKSFAQAETRVKPVLVGFNQFKAEAEAKLQAFAAELQNLNIPAAKLGNLEATAKQLQAEKQIVAEQALQYQSYIKLRNETAVRNAQELANLRTLEQQTAEARKLSEAYARANLSIGPSLGRQTSNNVPGGFAALGGATKAPTKVGASFADLGSNIYKPNSDYGINLATKMSQFYRQEQEKLVASKEKELAVNSRVRDSNSLLHQSLASLIVQYRAINFVYNQFLNALYNIPKVGIQLESTTASLTATFGSAAAAAKELQFLTQEAQRTGISVGTLREQYANAAASFIAAGESAETTRKIFENINTVSTTLHLSADRVSGVYLALSQIFNKTKLQAEELTKQLSQTIPGVTNQQAKALNITVSELYDSMKKGAISAHDAVLALSKTLGETFGGEAFLTATKGLNAEWGRLNTTWTLFTENLYKGSEGILKEVVKDLTGITESLIDLTSNTQSTKKAFDILLSTLTALAVGGAVAALGTAFNVLRNGMLAATAAGNGFVAVLTLISRHPLIAAGTALAGAATFFYSQSKAADAATASLEEYNRQLDIKYGKIQRDTLAEKRQQFEGSDVYKNAKNNLLEQEKLVERLKKSSVKETPGFLGPKREFVESPELKKAVEHRDQIQTELVNLEIQFNAEIKEQQKQAALDLESVEQRKLDILKKSSDKQVAYQAKLKEYYTNSNNKKDLENYMQVFSEAVANNDTAKQKEALDAIETYKQSAIAAVGEIDKATKSVGSGTSSGAKAFIAELKQIGLTAEQQRTFVSEDLANLNEDYANSLISIKDYYAKRTELETQYYSLAKQGFKEQAEAALRSGDRNKALEASTRLERTAQEESRKLSQTKIEETKAYIDLATAISGVNSEYLKAQGKSGDASLVEFQTKYAELRKRLAADSSPSSQQAQQQLNELEGWTAAISKSQDAVTGYELAKSNLAIQEERIQNSLRSGAITELDSLGRLQDARREAVKQMEEYVKVRENALTNVPRDNPEVIRLQQIRNELENLKLETNLFATKFGTVFTQNFSNAFSAFATGAMTAKEAFASFAQGVIKNLAEIAAQEASQQILKLVVSSIGSIGSAFGGSSIGTAGYGSAGSAAISSFLSSGFVYGANGLAATGMAGASGTILDKPTYFPNARPTMFASGGVVAGEAGAEAVLPLRRGKDGKLGVVMQNEGSSETGGFQIGSIIVNVDSSKDASSKEQGFVISRAIEERLNSMIDRRILNAKRTGGALA